MANYITERTAGQILSDSIRLYFRHLPAIFLIYLLPMLPILLLEADAAGRGDETGELIFGALDTVVSSFTLGAVAFAISDICLGNRPSVVRSYGALFRMFWPYLGAYLIYTVATIAGLALLIVPGFYVMVALLFCLPAVIIERRGAIEACKRSYTLGKGFHWRNLGIVLLILLVVLLVMLAIGVLLGMAIAIAGGNDDGFVANLIIVVLASLSAPLFQVAAILLYYDMRARKEHFDGAALAQELMT